MTWASKTLAFPLCATALCLVVASAAEARDFHRQLSQKKNADALEGLKGKLTVVVMPPAELQKMQEKSKPVIEKYTKTFGEPFVKEMYAEIAKVRGGK